MLGQWKRGLFLSFRTRTQTFLDISIESHSVSSTPHYPIGNHWKGVGERPRFGTVSNLKASRAYCNGSSIKKLSKSQISYWDHWKGIGVLSNWQGPRNGIILNFEVPCYLSNGSIIVFYFYSTLL